MSKEYLLQLEKIEITISKILSEIGDGSFAVIYGSFAKGEIDKKAEPSDVDIAVVTANLGFGGSPIGNRIRRDLSYVGRKINVFPTIDLKNEEEVKELLIGEHVLVGKKFIVVKVKTDTNVTG